MGKQQNNLEQLAAYEVSEQKDIPELNSVGYVMRHKKTGARIALLSNDDENKVFYIAFRTPPKDSTGVAHIIEHSVLCGSEKFPVKDPFIELAKGSLNTFLNAMTYPDKTVYPVASCNDKDFQNLMDVYLDAVFHPNIYKQEKIFRQEGWHYEMEDPDGDLTINGVVYNEMKGAFSSPDDVLNREIMNSLYPDTSYAVESGGDPEIIPELTYEDFLAFHSRYYHPSNSYIYLYGDMDMAEKLRWLDEEYLSRYDALEVDSALQMQKPFTEPVHVRKEYPITENESEQENTYLSCNFSYGDNLDARLYIALQVLDYVLCSAPGAPLQKALIDLGIGKDVYSFYENGILQPYFSIVAKGAEETQLPLFLETIKTQLERLVKEGLDKNALRAGLNYLEFRYREADFGSYPKGLMLGLQMLDSWLYADELPFLHVQANAAYQWLKEAIDTDYYDTLVQDCLLNNPHRSIVVVAPSKGLTSRKDAELAEKLSTYKNSLSTEKRKEIVENTIALKTYQEEPDAPEDLEKIPLLTRADLKKEPEPYVNEERPFGDTMLLYHDIFTNGIGYLRFVFDLRNVPGRLIPYVGLLKSILGLVDTDQYTYDKLFNEVNIWTGGIGTTAAAYTDARNPEKYLATFEVKVKFLYENMEQALTLTKEILLHSHYDTEKRLKELIGELKSQKQANMMSAGHSLAAVRALSYLSQTAALSDQLSGLPHYRMLEELDAHFSEKVTELTAGLEETVKYLFRPENLFVDYTGEQSSLAALEKMLPEFRDSLYKEPIEHAPYVPETVKKNEGFLSSSQVQYVCRAGDFSKKGLHYTGALRVLRVMMSYDYLWVQVRVKGGAYGCMCSFGRSGESYFVSYRDPNLGKTVETFLQAADYVRHFEADERTMTQFIIGAIGELDAPMTPSARGNYSREGYLTHYDLDMMRRERDELLSAEPETIRGLADYIDAFLSDECLCVVGNEEKIKEQAEMFGSTEYLFR